KLRIEKTIADESQVWLDEHRMVAVSFGELIGLLKPYFDVHVLEHDYERIIPWSGTSGNAIFACVKV
ncbi:SAM-dependent methyltransferase, partial [Pseudomonas stutzeri]|nr:SAM-dependent methyltransferase [Stutzerimonas stutzeri]